MVNTQQAQMQLDELKHGIIGLFKSRNSNVFKLVTDVNDNDTIDVISITQFGIIQKEVGLAIHYGTLKLFPDNMNMFEMLECPFDWNDFISSFSAKK